ncbi:MAG: response regulator transcription factor [Saprospiraceae bacterium]|nr:response regulator transcription factor [Saprospiraceae bacterium]
MQVLKVGIIDDHKLFVKGFSLLLKTLQQYQFDICIESTTEVDFLDKLKNFELDLIFLDLNLDQSDGIELIKKIKEDYTTLKVIVVSMIKESKFVREAFKAGADGYIYKETDVNDVATAISSVLEDEVYFGQGVEAVSRKNEKVTERQTEVNLNRFNVRYQLTKREIEILQMLVEGRTSKDISSILFISKDTVNVHRKNLMKKLNITNVVMLVKLVKDYNII